MERRNEGFQVLADEDRFGVDLRYLNGRFDCKVSTRDSGGDLCIRQKAVPHCTITWLRTSGFLSGRESSSFKWERTYFG